MTFERLCKCQIEAMREFIRTNSIKMAESPPLVYRKLAENSTRQTRQRIRISCVHLLPLVVVGFCQILCSSPSTTAASNADLFTNNKIFTHNRSTNVFDDADTTFFTRLRDLTAKRQESSTVRANTNSKTKGDTKFKSHGSNKSKKHKGSNLAAQQQKKERQPPNYYSSSVKITKPPSPSGIYRDKYIPSSAPTIIHPLTVLRTEMRGEQDLNVGVDSTFGRSGLDDLLHDDQEGRSSELTGPSASSDANFFKNFRDHAEDPMAQESGGPEPSYVRPEFPLSFPSGGSATGTGTGLDSSIDANSPYRSSHYPTRERYQAIPSGSYPTASAPASQPASGPSHSMTGPAQSQSQWDHKNVNYWPQKLNSYYGDDFTSNYMNQIQPKRPPQQYHQQPQQQLQHQNQYFGESGFADNHLGAGTNTIQKVSMMDRVSTFYTDYKLIAWIGFVVLTSVALLGALLLLYWQNPPTEVVTARDNLARRLTDPTLAIFVSEALRKFGEKNSNQTNFVSGKKKSSASNRTRRKLKNGSIRDVTLTKH